MQAYGWGFARIYNRKWTGFAGQVAPVIRRYYETKFPGAANRSVLDLCCGTGQLVRDFLDHGYRAVGIDLSEAMLEFARDNNREYVEAGRAEFIHSDASDFRLEERFGLVVSTFDALNHLENETALKDCFRCAYAAGTGLFVFDLNTRSGLRRWNSIHVDDGSDDILLMMRGIYDGSGDRAWTMITGFIREPNGLYDRCDELTFNTVFDLQRVKALLLETGWKAVHFARILDLETPLPDPEAEGRVFIVAGR